LIHPAVVHHPNPKTAFICGGGEGATLRELLRFNTIEKVVMVDIDEASVSMSRKHLPQHSAGAFEDKRTVLVHDDAKAYLEQHTDKYDIIVSDLCDPNGM
jgi:spermidine synthase